MTVGDRIRSARKKKDVSQQQLADACGVSRAAVSQWESGQTKGMKPENLLAASKFLGVQPEYLIHGTPSPHPPGGKIRSDHLRPAPPDTRRIPVISYIHAGHPVEEVDAYVQGDGFAEIAVDADLAQMLGRHAFALAVEGNSMAPEFQPGDVVVIDPDSPVRPGDVVVAKLDADDTATLKKCRDRGRAADGTPIIELVPLNDDYPTLVLDAANPGRLIGPVIEHRRRRRRE